MGRPSKQKAVVEKYFIKNKKTGKSEYRTCIFCQGTFAYNAFRLAKHLLFCPKTGQDFKSEEVRITSLFKAPELNSARSKINSSYSPTASTTTTCELGSFIPPFLKVSCSDENEVAVENHGLIQTENTMNIFESVNNDLLDNSIASTSSRHTSTYGSDCSDNNSVGLSGSTQSTRILNNVDVSKKSNIGSMDRYIDRLVNVQEQEQIWETLARACYASGTPLSFTENVYWQDVFKKIPPSLELPSRYYLSNTVLDAEYTRVETDVLSKINNAQFMSLQLDGWSNIRQEPIVNVILTTPEPVIFKIVDTGSNSHTGEYMASIIEDVFNSVNVAKIISVVTDNAKNMTCSWKILKEKFEFENISFYGCAAHILNLLNKDIMLQETFSLLGNSAKKICVDFKQSHMLNSLLKEYQNAEIDVSKKKIALKLPIVTRWGSNVQCFKSLILNKPYLQQVAICSKAVRYLSKTTKATILDNDVFWKKVETLLKILDPISTWILKLESETCNLSDVVCAFSKIEEGIKYLSSSLDSEDLKMGEKNILSCIENRRKMAIEQIHLAANLLDPRYKGKHLNKEKSVDASQFIYNLASRIEVGKVDVIVDLASYRTNTGLWSKSFVWDCLKSKTDGTFIDPITWWKGICQSSNLATVACAILQCPLTSASTERSFSTYGLVHTAKRNRLTTERASKLVYVKHNLKLQKNTNVERVTNSFMNCYDCEVEENESPKQEETDSDDTELLFQAVNHSKI